MLLKSIELQGYKTFAGRTSFEFAGAITCIVGPNGSGKSNIADAIRWVLGEQSYRLLRGKKTEDMIFAGSESRSRAGMASANILFDNSTGWLPVDYSEVSIARRAYRDGTNEYQVNGQRVRLKDISELLASSGLSERTYTIIGQGLVDAALALRAEERRRLFEEAAGIGLYRTRWEEAQRRLETTARNIERVEDILAELRPRLRSLERQARRAGQFEQVEKDLKALLLDYYGYHWYRSQKDLNEARDHARVQDSMFEAVQEEQVSLDQRLSTLREQIQGTRARLGSWHRESSQMHIQRESITRELAVSDERVRLITMQEQEAEGELIQLDQQIILYQERFNDSKQQTTRLNEELNEAQAQVLAAIQSFDQRKSDRQKLERTLEGIRKKLNDLTQRQNRLQASQTERQSQIERQKIALVDSSQATIRVDEDLRKAESSLKTAEDAVQQISTRRREAEGELEAHRVRMVDLENNKRKTVDECSNLKTELARASAQLQVLEQAEQALAGYASGTRLLLQSAQQGELSGAQGAFSSQLEVPEEFEPAIVAALGEYLDAVLLDEASIADDALELLVSNATRGALLPVGDLTPPTPIAPQKGRGILGVASAIVKAPPLLRPAVDLLLGQTLVVQDRAAARLALQGQPLTTRAVTLRGELFFASGPISVGQGGESSTISRPRQRRELQETISGFDRQISALNGKIQDIEDKLSGTQSRWEELVQAVEAVIAEEKNLVTARNQVALEVDRVSRQSQWQRQQRDQLEKQILAGEAELVEITGSLSQIREERSRTQEQLREQQSGLSEVSLSEAQSQVNYWQSQVAIAEAAQANVRAQQDERKAALAEVEQRMAALNARISSLRSSLAEMDTKKGELRVQEAAIITEIDKVQVLIDPAEAELEILERDQDNLQKIEAKARQSLTFADRRRSQAQLTLTRKQEILENLRERIENDLGLVSFEYDDEISGPTPLPLGEMVETLPRILELPEGLDETIKRQRAQLRRMGLVNPDAQSEYKEVKERFEFMTGQITDLHKAERDIHEVIAELDELMKREFNRTFEKVASEFREIFTRLFGGGTARLVLTDPDDLAETGIEIEARLPGRRTQGLSLLSGGERSLTATALVFSLLKVSPTPFCVLDEVDAMLDEANVGRFRDLLRELAENTQFIVITHNRNTVQAADVIYGVTMGRDSASQMISLKLDEVDKVV